MAVVKNGVLTADIDRWMRGGGGDRPVGLKNVVPRSVACAIEMPCGFSDRRAVRSKLLNQDGVSRWVVHHVLRGVVLADDPVSVDVTRAVGVPERLCGKGSIRRVSGLEIRPSF